MKGEREECWTLVGRRAAGAWRMRAVRHVLGRRHDVAFDAAWALAREERRADVVGFLHTHPTPSIAPSTRDVRTMRAWCSAFGKPLVCVIAHGDRAAGYRFEADGSGYVPLASVERRARGTWVGVDGHGGKIPTRRAVSRGGGGATGRRARRSGGAAPGLVPGRRRRRRARASG